MFQVTVSDASGGQHSVSENLGSDTDNEAATGHHHAGRRESTDNAHGVLTATMQGPLADV
jgi:hypothetical protein